MQSIAGIIPHGSIIPVVIIDDAGMAVHLANTLLECGIAVIEITLRTASAFDAAESIIRDCPDMCVGIGTITDSKQMQRALDIGARFQVSPGLSYRLVESASALNIRYMPAVATSSEVMQAMELGLEYLKFYPAERMGGTAMLAEYYSLFPGVKFCPTGGVNGSNAGDYLSCNNVFCIGGSWLVPRDAINQADWNRIRGLVNPAV